MQAAAILVEMAQVYEEKAGQPIDGFALRIQAFELAPDLMSIDQLAGIAEKYGQWKPLADLHVQRRASAGRKIDVPLDSALAASTTLETKALRSDSSVPSAEKSLPITVSAAMAATDKRSPQRTSSVGNGIGWLRSLHKKAANRAASWRWSRCRWPELAHVYHAPVDELVRMTDAGIEETSLRILVSRGIGQSSRAN